MDIEDIDGALIEFNEDGDLRYLLRVNDAAARDNDRKPTQGEKKLFADWLRNIATMIESNSHDKLH